MLKTYVATEVVGDFKAKLGEGPLWDAKRGLLHWVDIFGGKILSTNPATGETHITEVDGTPSMLALGEDRILYAMGRGIYAMGDDDMPLVVLPDAAEGRLNDGKTDPAGRLWVGTGHPERAPKGALWRWARSGPDEMLEGVTMSNGIGWSPDGTQMYYVDTLTRRLDVFDFDASKSKISNRRPLYEITRGLPDGLAVDAAGTIWLAIWGGGEVLNISAEGTLLGRIHVPTPCPTCCAFGGPNLDKLYITTAVDESIEGARKDHFAGALFVVSVGAKGQPVVECSL